MNLAPNGRPEMDFMEKKLGDFFTAEDVEKRRVAVGDRVLIHTA
jgi:hypothetical protein